MARCQYGQQECRRSKRGCYICGDTICASCGRDWLYRTYHIMVGEPARRLRCWVKLCESCHTTESAKPPPRVTARFFRIG